MYRLRESDFAPIEMENGATPGWPIGYAALEPYYCEAEKLFKVHGSSDGDPTDPPRSAPWPHDPIPHQGPVRDLVDRVTTRAGHPVAYIPRSIDYDPAGGGKCVLCRRCDGYYCPRDAKLDAEIGALRPAVATGRVELLTKTECVRVLVTPDGGRVTGVVLRRDGQETTVRTGTVAVGCGLQGTPLLLWRSRTTNHEDGLANRSGALGRYWGAHTQGWVFALKLGAQKKDFHQKTFAIHSFYHAGPDWKYPLGVIQGAGNIEPIGMSRRHRYFASVLLNHSIQTFAMTEDLPTKETGFALADDGAEMIAPPIRNQKTFEKLRAKTRELFRAAGYRVFMPNIMIGRFHSLGTARMGADPATSVVNDKCQAHDVAGLYVVDSSVLPSSGALNSGLTIAAVALRAAAKAELRG
jgi:choline dehydrogenase-like flavoprotein